MVWKKDKLKRYNHRVLIRKQKSHNKTTKLRNTTLQKKQLLQKYRNVTFFLAMP